MIAFSLRQLWLIGLMILPFCHYCRLLGLLVLHVSALNLSFLNIADRGSMRWQV